MGNEDHVHAALPKLYGAPAYARPPITPVRPVERPFDPDELPLTSELSPEERTQVDHLVARPYDGAASPKEMPASAGEPSMLRGRPFRLRSIGTLLRGSGRDNKDGGLDDKGSDRDIGPAQPQADASDAE
jgi:hypothetical protein